MAAILTIAGRGLPLRGHDIDTDRIMPARFLRAVSFDGLERHLFEDDRAADPKHPFNDPRYAGATVLVVNRNFGSGSSREHAPQGLARAGIQAIVGESFSEIFRGNAAMLGVPCFAVAREAVERLQALVEQSPDTTIEANVQAGIVTAGRTAGPCVAAAGTRRIVRHRAVESDRHAARSVRRSPRGSRATAIPQWIQRNMNWVIG